MDCSAAQAYHRAAGALLVVYNRDIPVVTAETLARLGARITAHSGAGGSSTLRWQTSAGAAREHVCRAEMVRSIGTPATVGQAFDGGWQDVKPPERGY